MKPKVSYPAFMAQMLSDREKAAVLARGDTFHQQQPGVLQQKAAPGRLEQLADAIIAATKSYVGKATAKLEGKVSELERRIKELEKR